MEYYDASRIATFQKCPKLFDYKHGQGYQAKVDSMDLLFGHLLGEALELFEKQLAAGVTIQAAHQQALAGLLAGSFNPDGTSKFGSYQPTWRCKGTTKYVNDKGNAAKCPYSHKGKYFIPPAPDTCACGSETEAISLWMPIKAGKDIDRLVELLVGYTDNAATRQLIPATLDGAPLIEHYWETPFNHAALLKPVMLCGNLDAVKSFGDDHYIVDYKTTGKGISEHYWRGFSPNVQVDLYNMAAKKVLPTLQIKGVAIEAFSTSGGSGFKIFSATDEQNAEMFTETAFWIGLIQQSQRANIYPRNRTACFMCEFQPVCSRPPSERQALLDANFERAKWNPKTRKVEPLPTAKIIPFPSPKSGTNTPSMPTPRTPPELTPT